MVDGVGQVVYVETSLASSPVVLGVVFLFRFDARSPSRRRRTWRRAAGRLAPRGPEPGRGSARSRSEIGCMVRGLS